jgi:hypothetical protein
MANLSYVDNAGRILLDGYHVGWTRKEASSEAVEELCWMVTRSTAVNIPNRTDIVDLVEADTFPDNSRSGS